MANREDADQAAARYQDLHCLTHKNLVFSGALLLLLRAPD